MNENRIKRFRWNYISYDIEWWVINIYPWCNIICHKWKVSSKKFLNYSPLGNSIIEDLSNNTHIVDFFNFLFLTSIWPLMTSSDLQWPLMTKIFKYLNSTIEYLSNYTHIVDFFSFLIFDPHLTFIDL